jgi:hypothetical protein
MSVSACWPAADGATITKPHRGDSFAAVKGDSRVLRFGVPLTTLFHVEHTIAPEHPSIAAIA